MMVEHLKHEMICVKMGARWSAQNFRQTGVTPPRSWCFPSFVLSEDLAHVIFTYFQCRCGGEGVAGGVNGSVERCSGRAWGVFSNLE